MDQNLIIPFAERYPHTCLYVQDIDQEEVADEDIPLKLASDFRLLFKKKYCMVSINKGEFKGLMHKNIVGLIKCRYSYNIYYEFGTDMTIEIIMATRI